MKNAIVPIQGRTVFLGFQNEHNVRTIYFDVATWALAYPDAEFIIKLTTATNQIVYPMFTMESGIITWTVGSDATVRTPQNGYGKLQLMLVMGEDVLKECGMRTAVEKTIAYTPAPSAGCNCQPSAPQMPPMPHPMPQPMPPAAPDWVVKALQAKQEAQFAAQEAAEYYNKMLDDTGELAARMDELEAKADEDATVFYETKYDLPGVGQAGYLYVINDLNIIVRWDEETLSYQTVGFSNDVITGGNANG